VQNNGAQLRVTVRGNTASGKYVFLLHGGPGVPVEFFRTEEMKRMVESRYAVVYYDQRNAGSSQGGSNIDQMRIKNYQDDTDKVFQVLVHRYGADIGVFVLSHSWGGILAPPLIARHQNQIKGWINAASTSDIPFTVNAGREMLLAVGPQQIQMGRHVDKWNEIIAYCQAHPRLASREEIYQVTRYAGEATTLIEEVNDYGGDVSILLQRALNDNMPFTAASLLYQMNANTNNSVPLIREELYKASVTEVLPQITVPFVAFFGKYDFVIPVAEAQAVMDQIRSTKKEIILFQKSAHDIYLQEPERFCSELVSFIEKQN